MGETVTDTYTTELIEKDDFERYWPSISSELDRVPHIWQRWYTKEALYQMALSGQFKVWGVGPVHQVRFVVFTQVIQYISGFKVLQGTLAFGNDVERCIPVFTASMEKMANDLGCKEFEIIGRRGWEKLLSGFKERNVILVRELQHFKVQ